MNLKDVSAVVRQKRIDRGMTQAELAEASGMKREAVARIESGRHYVNLRTLFEIAHALDLTIAITDTMKKIICILALLTLAACQTVTAPQPTPVNWLTGTWVGSEQAMNQLPYQYQFTLCLNDTDGTITTVGYPFAQDGETYRVSVQHGAHPVITWVRQYEINVLTLTPVSDTASCNAVNCDNSVTRADAFNRLPSFMLVRR